MMVKNEEKHGKNILEERGRYGTKPPTIKLIKINFYSTNILGVARLSGATARLVFKYEKTGICFLLHARSSRGITIPNKKKAKISCNSMLRACVPMQLCAVVSCWLYIN